MPKYRFDEIAINSTAKKKPVEEDKYTYLGLEHLDSESLKVTRFGSDVAPKGEKLLMKKGDVLFGKRRAYQKKVAIAPFDGIFSAHGMVLRPKEEVIDKDFFPLFISSDYFLDAYKKLLETTDQLVKSQFIELTLQHEYPKHTVKDILNSSFWLMPATPKYIDSGVIYITSKNLKNREISFEDVKYISQEDYEKISKNRPVMVGDVLIGMIGTIGQVGVVRADYPTFYGQNIYLLRLDESKINRRYFCEFMKSDSTQNILLGEKNGSTQAYLKANHNLQH